MAAASCQPSLGPCLTQLYYSGWRRGDIGSVDKPECGHRQLSGTGGEASVNEWVLVCRARTRQFRPCVRDRWSPKTYSKGITEVTCKNKARTLEQKWESGNSVPWPFTQPNAQVCLMRVNAVHSSLGLAWLDNFGILKTIYFCLARQVRFLIIYTIKKIITKVWLREGVSGYINKHGFNTVSLSCCLYFVTNGCTVPSFSFSYFFFSLFISVSPSFPPSMYIPPVVVSSTSGRWIITRKEA